MINLEQIVADAREDVSVAKEESQAMNKAFRKKYPRSGTEDKFWEQDQFEKLQYDQDLHDRDQARLNVRHAELAYHTALAQLDISKCRLIKAVDDMTDAELQAFDKESADRQVGLKAALPADLVPMPTPEEDLELMKKLPIAKYI